MEARESTSNRCGNNLCREEATHAITVRSAWSRDKGTDKARPRHYALCAKHYATYLPRGEGYMDRTNATRLCVQCRESEWIGPVAA